MEEKTTEQKYRPLDIVDSKHFDLVLLAHCFVSGMIDAATFNNWNVFVGGQTGNSVILALSTAGLPMEQPWSWLTTLVSIVSYLIGAFVTARLSYRFIPLCRLTITTNFMMQGILIVVAAALVSAPHPYIPEDDLTSHPTATLSDPRIVTVIPLLAFQGGAQITTSKLLGLNEIPINVLTSVYALLMSDENLFTRHNVQRNRRIASIILLFAGSACAAWIMRTGHGVTLCLWIGALIKVVAALCVGFIAPPEKGVL